MDHLILSLFYIACFSLCFIFLSAGLGGSRLQWKNSTSKTRTLWLDFESLLPPTLFSWIKDFRVFYNETTDTFHGPAGVQVSPIDFGGVNVS